MREKTISGTLATAYGRALLALTPLLVGAWLILSVLPAPRGFRVAAAWANLPGILLMRWIWPSSWCGACHQGDPLLDGLVLYGGSFVAWVAVGGSTLLVLSFVRRLLV